MADLSYLQSLQQYEPSNLLGKFKASGENIWGNIKDWFIEPRDSEIKDMRLHIYGTETMNLQADITDYYVENNIAYQDHIALKPKVFTLSGEVGELTWFRKDEDNTLFSGFGLLSAVEQKLQPVVAFLPPISKQASAIQEKALKIMNVVDSIDNFANRVIGLLSNEDVDTEQKKSYKYLTTLWQMRQPIDIRTPYGKMKNYVIQNIEFTQPDRTKDKSTVKISFKEFKTVIEKRSLFDKLKLQGRSSAQQLAKQSKGTTSGVTMEKVDCKCWAWCPI